MSFRLLVCVSLLLAPCISGSLSPATLQSSLSSLISPNLCQLKLICAISQSDSLLRESVFMRGISTLADLTAGTFLGNLTTDAFLLQYSIEAGECVLFLAATLPIIMQDVMIYCQVFMNRVLGSDWPALQPCRPPMSVL